MVSAGAAVCLSGCQSVLSSPVTAPRHLSRTRLLLVSMHRFAPVPFGVHCRQQVHRDLQQAMENMGCCLTGPTGKGRRRASQWASLLFTGSFRAGGERGSKWGRGSSRRDQILQASMDK